jgi:hypothetical protein
MKYRKQSKYPSCQLIAAINARIFLGKNDISDELFEELVDLVKCRHGGAICIKEAYPILGLTYEDNPKFDPLWIMENLPVNLTIHDPEMGFHSILVDKVKYECKFKDSLTCPRYRVINYTGAMSTWLAHLELTELLPIWEHQFRSRTFRRIS